MFTLPPIPTWSSLHPLAIHFPIALLLIAPLFIIIGVILQPKRSFPFLLAALLLMAVGTGGAFLAAASGDAAKELAEGIPQTKSVIEKHENLAETTEVAFSALTLIFASILFIPKVFKAEPTRMTSTVLPLAFLVLYGAGAVTLINTAHQGGRLVYELGIRAPIPAGAVTFESAERE